MPGLSVKRNFGNARECLLAAFPDIEEVVATTAPGTLLVLSSGAEDVDAWLRELRAARLVGQRGERPRLPSDSGTDPAA